MLPYRIRQVLVDIKIPPDMQRLLGQFDPCTSQFQNYSLLFVFWLSHSRSFLNSASVTGKIGLMIRNLRTKADERLISRRTTAQASAHHPQSQCRSKTIKNNKNTTSIT